MTIIRFCEKGFVTLDIMLIFIGAGIVASILIILNFYGYQKNKLCVR